MYARLLYAAPIALIAALLCWALTALHGVWSYGIVLEYLGKAVPIYPDWTVTYWSFFMDSMGAFLVTFFVGMLLCAVLPARHQLPALLATWLFGFYCGALGTAFIYESDFSDVWIPFDAFKSRYIHIIVTPIVVLAGMVGSILFTRSRRTPIE